jgi:hypothetical protein
VKPIQALGQILSPANSASGFSAWSREARRLEAVHLEQVGAALAERGHGLLHGPVGVRQRHPLQGGVLLDDLAEEVVPGGRGDEGADGPDGAQLEAAVGVQGLRDAAAVVVARGGSGGGGVRRSRGRGAVHPGAAEDDAALQRAAEHGLPPEHDAVVGAHVGDRELHPEAADAAEVPQHLGGRVVLLLLLRVLLRRRGLGVAVREGLEHGEQHGLEEVRERGARARRPRVGGVGGDDAVDAQAGVVHERDQRAEAARHRGAAPQRPRVGQLVEDEQHEGVGHPVEVVLALRRRRPPEHRGYSEGQN